ncbi:TPA: GTP-binding protein [Candidatus Woesearchaeota archaeon]|nr:GTP-binding protein [Candidatus Woesearchaeota archaeon]HII69396.1 GTP-binding protein [Candidatus Woesearchaeota archaeon]
MANTKDKIKELRDELSKTKYNKRTQHHVGLVKAKIAVLREKEEKRLAGKGGGEGYNIRKTGDGTVILVGFPSVGKSTLLNALTNAESAIAAYAFTTLTCIPGLLEYNHAKIQVLDVPGVVEGAASGRGRGREVLSCAMSADLVLLMIDVFKPENREVIMHEVREANLRINETKPDVKIEKTSRGGITIGTTCRLTRISRETIEAILKEFRIMNASVTIREDINEEQLIDVIEGNKKYLPGIVALNKIDLVSDGELAAIQKKYKPDILVSAHNKTHLEELKQLIFDRLDLMRIYCKDIGKKADLDIPVIISRKGSLGDFADKLHRNFQSRLRFARIWGRSARFDGQQIRKLEHKLEDGDIVELHLR